MLNLKDLKAIPGTNDRYYVCRDGFVYNAVKRLKTHTQNSGYQQITFTIDRSRKKHLVHRLVATAFIPNPDNKPHVNHIDGDKANNAASNLEWCTVSENILHARALGLNPYNLPTLGIKKGKGSKYRNVSYDKKRNKWIACIRHNKVTIGSKRFDSEEDAARHVDYLIDLHGLNRPKNF